jgi:parvulin-like peptidyl-prolyl isomerase
MKKFMLFLCMFISINNVFAARRLVNNIVARVNGANILRSDLQKPRIHKNGQPFTLDEAITEELLLQKSSERRLLPTELEVEKQIVSLKIHNNLADLSDKEFDEQLKSEGFTVKEYKNQLARMLAVEKLKHAEFSERVVVTSQEVEDYCKNNPEWAQEEYKLKFCEVDGKYVDEKGELKNSDKLKWEELGWVKKTDLSEHLSFVSNMKKDETSNPVKVSDSYHVVKVEDKKEEHLKTLDERYLSVESMLQNRKKEKFEVEFEKELKDKAMVVFLEG